MLNNITYFVDKIDECNTCYQKNNLINCKVCSWSSCPNCWYKWIEKGHNRCPHCKTTDFSLSIYFLVFKMNYNKYYNYYYNYYKNYYKNNKNNIVNILFSFLRAYILGYYYCDINFLPQPDLICKKGLPKNNVYFLMILEPIYKGYLIQIMTIFIFVLFFGSILQLFIICSMISNSIIN
jgi:hypothetical protein